MFERQHGKLTVTIYQYGATGQILTSFLEKDEDRIQLSTGQLYALVDDVAVADPEEWAKRFDPRDAIERHLRRVADYFQERAVAHEAAADMASDETRIRWRGMEDAFAVARTRVLEEIESLGPDTP
jgi:hypothetical protein